MGDPVVGREGNAPEFGGGSKEFDTHFAAAIGSGTSADDANELFFFGFRILDKNFLTDFHFQRQVDQCTVGTHRRGECVFRDVGGALPTSNREDGHAEENALATPPVVRWIVTEWRCTHANGPDDSLGQRSGVVKRRIAASFFFGAVAK